MRNKTIIIVLSVLCLSSAIGCSDFLEEKSDSRLVTPETLEDNQALLDRISNLLGGNSISAEISSDDIYITDSDYNGSAMSLINGCTPGSLTWYQGQAVTTGRVAFTGSTSVIRF